MSSSKKFTCKGTLRQVFICLSLLPSYDSTTLPLTHCIRVCILYTYSYREGGYES